jgi:2-polyprenyl-3-methyl-5-hydroxy-6-metoxy-1,4-benzoquinol methylase
MGAVLLEKVSSCFWSGRLRSPFVIYQDPLAYLLGLEGLALLDAWAGDQDRDFVETRLEEIRRLLDDEKVRNRGVLAERVSSVTAYEQRSASYDAEAGGGLFALDEPLVAEYVDGREPGVALDAACGTGRFAEFLALRGHRVIGVDSCGSPMVSSTSASWTGCHCRMIRWTS